MDDLCSKYSGNPLTLSLLACCYKSLRMAYSFLEQLTTTLNTDEQGVTYVRVILNMFQPCFA